jgi:hypothetical protein
VAHHLRVTVGARHCRSAPKRLITCSVTCSAACSSRVAKREPSRRRDFRVSARGRGKHACTRPACGQVRTEKTSKTRNDQRHHFPCRWTQRQGRQKGACCCHTWQFQPFTRCRLDVCTRVFEHGRLAPNTPTHDQSDSPTLTPPFLANKAAVGCAMCTAFLLSSYWISQGVHRRRSLRWKPSGIQDP